MVPGTPSTIKVVKGTDALLFGIWAKDTLKFRCDKTTNLLSEFSKHHGRNDEKGRSACPKEITI